MRKNLNRLMEVVFQEPWAIMPGKLEDMGKLLMSHVRGDVTLTESALFDDDEDGDENEHGYHLEGHVAIVPVHGVIGKRLSWLALACGGCDVDRVRMACHAAKQDPLVKSILLDFDTPGGTVNGTPELGKYIAQLSAEIPVVSFTEKQMCSAGYWMGSSGGQIIVTPTAAVGSIGVIIAALDDSARWREEGYKPEVFKSGPLKDLGSRGVAWRDEWREFLQASVDKNFELFKSHVMEQRGTVAAEALSGGWWSGDQLLEMNLVDGYVDCLADLVQQMNEQF